MSANLAVLPETASLAKKRASRVLNLCHNLESMRDDFLPLLPILDDDVVMEIRVGARAVSVWAWVVEAACDAEMLSRVEKRTKHDPQSATHDGLTKGREAAKREKAELEAKSTRTIERNAQIINTFGLDTIAEHGR